MSRLSKVHPTSIQPAAGAIPNEISPLSNLSNQIEEIVQEGGNSLKMDQGNVVMGVARAHTNELDSWIGQGAIQVGHPPPVKRFVALNESGTQRIGEDHPQAKLTNAQVEAIRDEYEAHPLGHPLHVGYRVLAQRWGVSKRTIRDICNYEKRNQWAGRWKRIT